MTPEQLSSYIDRASSWLQSDRSDLSEAITLCTAIPSASVFVEYAKCYGESYRRSEAERFLSQVVPEVSSSKSAKDISVPKGSSSQSAKGVSVNEGSSSQCNRASSDVHVVTPIGTEYTYSSDGKVKSVSGTRPAHYDEWKHLMPTDLQQKIDRIKDNYDMLSHYRREVERLAADPKHSEADLSRVAKLCVHYEDANLNIFAQADAVWEELCGKQVSAEVKSKLLSEERTISRNIDKLTSSPISTPSQSVASSPSVAEAPSSPSPSPTCAEAPSSPSPSPTCAEAPSSVAEAPVPLTDEYLSSLSYSQLASIPDDQLPEGPRRYWVNRRIDAAKKYLRDKLPEHPSQKQIDKAQEYVFDIISSGGTLSKKIKERLHAAGITLS